MKIWWVVILLIAFQNCSKIKLQQEEAVLLDKPANAATVQVSDEGGDQEEVPSKSTPASFDLPKPNTPQVQSLPVTPAPPKATGKFFCMRRGDKTLVEDLYEKWSDGSYILKEKCSDWHSTVKENRGFNCGTPEGYPINAGFSSCCPDGSVTVNGRCLPEAGLGESCFADANCKAGLSCADVRTGSDVSRKCQPKR